MDEVEVENQLFYCSCISTLTIVDEQIDLWIRGLHLGRKFSHRLQVSGIESLKVQQVATLLLGNRSIDRLL